MEMGKIIENRRKDNNGQEKLKAKKYKWKRKKIKKERKI